MGHPKQWRLYRRPCHLTHPNRTRARMNASRGELRIGLLGIEDPADVGSYSGTSFHLVHFLRAAGNSVSVLGPYPLRHRIPVRLHNRLRRRLTGKGVLWERHWLIAGQYPAIVRRYMERNPELDLLLATSVFSIAGVRSQDPRGVVGRHHSFRCDRSLCQIPKPFQADASAVSRGGAGGAGCVLHGDLLQSVGGRCGVAIV